MRFEWNWCEMAEWRIQRTENFVFPLTQFFSGGFFSWMCRQEYIFDFKFEISIKFRVEWCIRLYDSYWICLRLPVNSYLRRREYVQNIGNIGKFDMNHIVLYIIRREILCWFWSQKIFPPTHSRETQILRKLRGWIQKVSMNHGESHITFDYELLKFSDTF